MKNDAPNIIPLHDKIILRRDDKAKQDDGIWIPDHSQIHGWAATVVKINKSCCFKVGTRVFYHRKHTVCPFEDRRYVVTEAKYLVATLKPNKAQTYEQVFPLRGWVLLEPDVEHVEKNGITPAPSHKPEQTTRCGTIMRTGYESYDAPVGTRVIYGLANLIRCVENDTELDIVQMDDVLARID